MTRVVLHIDRLELNGYAEEEHAAIVDALRDEIVRHYSAPQAAEPLRAHPHVESIQPVRVSVPTPASPRATGRQAARGIAKGLSR
jgi:hypothetical protein